LQHFKGRIAITKMNFEHVWDCSLARHNHVGRTIPLINTGARGYVAPKLKWQIEMLKTASRDVLVKWEDRDSIVRLLS
jgi:hypothetical protein